MRIAPELLTLNLSFIQVKSNRELIRDVVETTAKWGLAPSDIEFDVTEEILAKATLAQNDALARLRGLGSRVAIDNFGTKYSSFDYFRSYGVSELKMAPIYLSESDHDPGRAATLRAVMTMARELNLRVVAEGVETRQQCKSLLASCSTTQTKGYYLGPPIDAGRAGSNAPYRSRYAAAGRHANLGDKPAAPGARLARTASQGLSRAGCHRGSLWPAARCCHDIIRNDTTHLYSKL
jgi:EAL domain-containing protein (putative c-di-GMP-specific phosphodiesterase class I)